MVGDCPVCGEKLADGILARSGPRPEPGDLADNSVTTQADEAPGDERPSGWQYRDGRG